MNRGSTYPKPGFKLADSHAMCDYIGSVLLGNPLPLAVEDPDKRGGLVRGELLAKPRDPGPPPLLGELLQFNNLQRRC